MRVNALDGVTAAFLMSVTFRTTNPYYITLIASRTTAVLLEETGPAGTATKTSLTRLVPFGAWTKVDFDVDFAAATPSLTLKFDGVVALTKQLASGFESGFEQLSIGPRYYTLATVVATDVNFDNVLIDLK